MNTEPKGDGTLLIVGAGELGGRVGRLWKQRFPDAQVIAETRSPDRHEVLSRWGLSPRLRTDAGRERVPHVLFAVPPSQVEALVGEVSRASGWWNRQGSFVLVSSTAVYAEQDGGTCEEDSPLSDSERARTLLGAEARCREAGGMIVRMAGLYAEHRGPHKVYMRTERSPAPGNGWVNLIHYDDAASLCLRVLLSGEPERTYLGCDGHPLTREELARAAWQSERFPREKPGDGPCTFAAAESSIGRRCSNTATRRNLSWEPMYHSFQHWLQMPMDGQDEGR